MARSGWKNWGLLPRVLEHARLALRLLREPGVPWWLKLLVVAPFAYALWPLDLIPDFLPIAGQIDDLAILLLTIDRIIALCPPALVEFHRSAIRHGARYTPADEAATARPR